MRWPRTSLKFLKMFRDYYENFEKIRDYYANFENENYQIYTVQFLEIDATKWLFGMGLSDEKIHMDWKMVGKLSGIVFEDRNGVKQRS